MDLFPKSVVFLSVAVPAWDATRLIHTHSQSYIFSKICVKVRCALWVRNDQAVVVLRNGVAIGRSRAALPVGSEATHVLTLGTDAAGAPLWFYVGVAGQAEESGRPVAEAVPPALTPPPPSPFAVALPYPKRPAL